MWHPVTAQDVSTIGNTSRTKLRPAPSTVLWSGSLPSAPSTVFLSGSPPSAPLLGAAAVFEQAAPAAIRSGRMIPIRGLRSLSLGLPVPSVRGTAFFDRTRRLTL
jgi:hypothetical protein